MKENVMLCEVANANIFSMSNRNEYFAELKYDGTRALISNESGKVCFFNRRGKDISHRYPELIEACYSLPPDTIIDCEIVVFDNLETHKTNFSKLLSREQLADRDKIRLQSKFNPVKAVVFDIIKLAGEKLTQLPIEKRKERLKGLFNAENPFFVLPLTWLSDDLEKAWNFVLEYGHEGLILKKHQSFYYFDRSPEWLKLKKTQTETFKLKRIDITENGGFCCICPNSNGEEVKIVCNKLSEQKRISEAVKAGLDVMVEIAFLEITERHNYRQPTFYRAIINSRGD